MVRLGNTTQKIKLKKISVLLLDYVPFSCYNTHSLHSVEHKKNGEGKRERSKEKS